MKIIVTIIPTDLVTNWLLSSFLFLLTNQKQESGFQQVVLFNYRDVIAVKTVILFKKLFKSKKKKLTLT